MGYNVSDANSYLVITGGGIPDVKICKKAWVWSWQKVKYSALHNIYPSVYVVLPMISAIGELLCCAGGFTSRPLGGEPSNCQIESQAFEIQMANLEVAYKDLHQSVRLRDHSAGHDHRKAAILVAGRLHHRPGGPNGRSLQIRQNLNRPRCRKRQQVQQSNYTNGP